LPSESSKLRRPRSPAVSESNNNVWSLVHVAGSEFSDTMSVPHGAVAAITYYSTALGKFRRMHIYTPPDMNWGSANIQSSICCTAPSIPITSSAIIEITSDTNVTPAHWRKLRRLRMP
jgi:hypothetical protein